MEAKNNILVRFLDGLRDLFEHMSPSLFALMATMLPYLSPLPIAIFTATNAEEYLGFTPVVSGIFVFVLEALGLWVTSVLVDSVLEFIRSRNSKTGVMILIFGAVTGVYITILINLNVSLETSDPTKVVSPAYSRIITLISFIPLLTGFMNGWHKAKLDNEKRAELAKIETKMQNESESETAHRRKMELEKLQSDERIRKAELRNQRTASKSFKNPLQNSQVFEADTSNTTSNALDEASKDKSFEAVSKFFEAYLSKFKALPKTQPIMDYFKVGQSTAYYYKVKYIFENAVGLVEAGIISQEDADKNAVSHSKMPKGSKK